MNRDSRQIRQARRENRTGNVRDFFRGFLITTALILPLFAATYYFSGNRLQTDSSSIAQSVESPIGNLPVTTAKSYNLLWMVTDAPNDRLVSATLIRFDVENYRVAVCELPVLTVLLDAQSAPLTLFEIHSQRGALGVRAAVEKTLSVPVSGYVSITGEDLAQMVDTLGEFEFTLDRKLDVYGENGLLNYSKPAGTSLLTGNDVAKLLTQGNYAQEDKIRLHESLWSAALWQYADDVFGERLSNYYQRNVNSIQTDINTINIGAMVRAVQAVCPSGGAQIDIVRLRGSFTEIGFELAEGADSRLWTDFSQLRQTASENIETDSGDG